jgi:hypothetical protein
VNVICFCRYLTWLAKRLQAKVKHGIIERTMMFSTRHAVPKLYRNQGVTLEVIVNARCNIFDRHMWAEYNTSSSSCMEIYVKATFAYLSLAQNRVVYSYI